MFDCFDYGSIEQMANYKNKDLKTSNFYGFPTHQTRITKLKNDVYIVQSDLLYYIALGNFGSVDTTSPRVMDLKCLLWNCRGG